MFYCETFILIVVVLFVIYVHKNRLGDQDEDAYYEDSQAITDSPADPVPDPVHDPNSHPGREDDLG